MPNNNNLIPKENLAQVEEVREIENKELIMLEQQAKVIDYFKERQNLINNKSKLSLAARSKIIKRHGTDYLSERAFDHDISLVQMYGPGFWDDLGEGLWEVGKFTGKVIATGAAAGVIVSTGGLAAPAIGGVVYAGGKAVKKFGEESNCKFVEGLGDFVEDVGIGGFTGGVLGTASSSLASRGANSAFNAGVRTAGTNGSKVLLNTWIYTKMVQEGYSLGGKGKNAMEGFCRYYHGKHKNRGVSYDSECPICNGHFDKFFWL